MSITLIIFPPQSKYGFAERRKNWNTLSGHEGWSYQKIDDEFNAHHYGGLYLAFNSHEGS